MQAFDKDTDEDNVMLRFKAEQASTPISDFINNEEDGYDEECEPAELDEELFDVIPKWQIWLRKLVGIKWYYRIMRIKFD